MPRSRYKYREPVLGISMTRIQRKSWGIIINAFRKYRTKCITYDMIMGVWREMQGDIPLKAPTLDRHIRIFAENGLLERKPGSKRKTLICLPDRIWDYYIGG